MSIYKNELTPYQHRMASAHAMAINISQATLGHNIHDPITCPTCSQMGAMYSSVVQSQTEVIENASQSENY